MVNVFGNMVKKTKDERFIKKICESMTPKSDINTAFIESYNQYQQRAKERKKYKKMQLAKF